MREAYGITDEARDESRGHRLGVVLELLRGVPPGVLSAREGVAEPELYRWRDAVLRGAAEGLGEESTSNDSRAWLDRLR